MNKATIATLLVMASAALAVAGCEPVAPTMPTWEHDIHPLMVARCIRCHSGSGNIDPLSGKTPIGNFSFQTFDPSLPGVAILQTSGMKAVRGEGLRRMPPPPAEALEDWQIEMLDTWLKNPR